jgi:hypothetical protein
MTFPWGYNEFRQPLAIAYGERGFVAGGFRDALAASFTFFCGKKSNKKSRPKTIYSPFSGAALLGSSAG